MKCYMCGEEFKEGDTIAVINNNPVHSSQCDNGRDCEIDYLYECSDIRFCDYGSEDYKLFEEEHDM